MKWNNRRTRNVKNYNRFSRKAGENLACQLSILNFCRGNRSICYLVQQTTTITRNPNNARLIRVILAVYINNIGPVYGGDNSQCVRWEKWFEENIKQAFRYICYSPLERLWDIRVDISSWLLDNWIQTKFSIDENESKRLVEIIYREIRFQSDRKSRLTFLSLSLSFPPSLLFIQILSARCRAEFHW